MRRTGLVAALTLALALILTGGAAYAGWTRTWEYVVSGGRVVGDAADPTTRAPVTTPRTAPPTSPERAARPPKATPEPAPKPAGGKVLLRSGDRGPQVRELQARLRQIAWFTGDVTDFYGEVTTGAVEGFQAKRGFPATGVVDERTWKRLLEMSSQPTADELANALPDPAPATSAPLDSRCLTGRVLCVDKTSRTLRWVVDGQVRVTLDARFGGPGYATREGVFTVSRKSRDHVSSLYETSMPFAMFFSGGQAVHYSPDFAAHGYDGASHGCVNIRDYDAIASLFDQVQLGDQVVVSWS